MTSRRHEGTKTRNQVRTKPNFVSPCLRAFVVVLVTSSAACAPAPQTSNTPAAGSQMPRSIVDPYLKIQAALASEGGLKEHVKVAMSRLERELVSRALQQTGGNVTHAARLLKISRKGLQLKMKELGLREGSADKGE